MGQSGAPTAETHPDPARHLGTMRVLLVALGAVSALIMLAGTAASLWRMRSGRAGGALQPSSRILAVVLAEQTDRAVDQIDLVLQGAAAEVDAPRRVARARSRPSAALHDRLAAQLRSARAPQLRALALIDAHGDLVAFTEAFPPPTRSSTATATTSAPTATVGRQRLFIGAPLDSRSLPGVRVRSGQRAGRPSRRRFGGVVAAAIPAAYFVDLYRVLKLGPGSAVRLYRRDGVLLASFPPEPRRRAIRSRPLPSSARRCRAATRPWCTSAGPSSIVAASALADYPLVVTASAAETQVLAPWRRNAWIFGAIAGLAAAFVVGLAFTVERRLAADARLRGELREGAARLDAIVQSAMDAMITVDPEQRIVLFNDAAERMFGVDARRRSARPSTASSPSASARRIAGTSSGSAAPARPRAAWASSRRCGALRADGTEFRIEASISHATVSGQQLFTVILRDITERLATEARVREGEARLEAIVQSAMDAIITVNAEQRIVLFNRAAERMFGVAAREAVGAPLADFIPERFRANHQEHIERFGRTGETARRMGPQRTLHALRADGTEFPIEASISHATVGGEQLFSVIIRDITARLAAAAEIERSHAQLRELGATMHEVREAEQTRIARELHDELGQALTALKMDVELLESLTPPDRADLLERTGAMRGLLDSTVQTTRRISADLRPLVLDDLGLAAAAEWLVHQLRQRARIDCDLVIDSSLADLPEPYASAIFRVMQESLTNVAKHARASHVELRLAREDGSAVLTVRDDGVGMGQADQAKPRSFGLRGIRERILVLGGEVRIVSQPGGGTIVVVRVPLGEAPGREAA